MGIAATLLDSIRVFFISSTVPMATGPIGRAVGIVGGGGGVFGRDLGGVLGEVSVGVPLGKPVGDGVNIGFAEGPLTLDGSGLTGCFSGVFALVPDSGPKVAKTGASLCLGDSLGSAVGVFSPSDSDSVLLKESLLISNTGGLVQAGGSELGSPWGGSTFLYGVPEFL